MAFSLTPRPAYVFDTATNEWIPVGVGGHSHPDYITQATAVNPTIIDAKGDIITATAADTPARLAVGNNGETLVADSAATTGLRYQAGRTLNGVINGGMDIWQRGTSIAGSGASLAACYTVDRWRTYRAALASGLTTSRQTSSVTGVRYAARVQRDSGNAGTGLIHFDYALETSDAIKYAGQTITFSFYAKAGANFSAASSNLSVTVLYGTGTDQPADAFAGATAVISSTATLTTTAQRFTFTAAVPSTATELGWDLGFTPVGTAGANDWFEVTGVQVEIGSVATPFQRSAGTIQGELAACQRYYFRSGASNGAITSAYNLHAQGYEESATSASICFKLPVTMRVAPTAIEYANVDIYDSTARSLSALTINGSYNNTNSPELVATGTGMAQYRPCFLLNWNNTGGYVALTAEL